MLYDIPTNLYAPHWQCQLPSGCNESRLFDKTKPSLSRIGHSSFLCLGIMQIPMHFLSIAFRLDCSFGRLHHLALYARIFVIFFQISDKHRIQPQFLADFLRIECLRKRSGNTFVLIYHDGSQHLAPSLFRGFSSSRMMRRAVMSAGLTPPTLLA